ncbi:MAG TPA: PASTA domain-containing protein [Candidatus Sphingobacterium stercoripullorum]|uniref:PASTA domain-containing protein n=1 Tax=Candidatus Sphingobacterium stercoripullorum TaxID=2838759 RepID=A0A9D1WAT1_9SPHI|nr:PASTA domain-containing protein [Candidatus Sphingobacterium stercoripullorum]
MSKFFQYLKTKAFRRTLIGIIIFIVAFFLAIYFGLSQYTRHGNKIMLPDTKGMNITEASKTLKDKGLRVEIDSIYQMDEQPGKVIDQDPEPGSGVKRNRTIYLTMITQSAPEVEFPDIVDKNLIEARAIITNNSLKIGDTTYIADIARDVILEVKFGGHSIKPGTSIKKGSTIDLVLGDGRGPNEIHIPNLLGLTLNEAKFAITGSGLVLGDVHYEGSVLDSLNAKVIEQDPAIEKKVVSIGSIVNLTLSED